jgi:hypothetical protein
VVSTTRYEDAAHVFLQSYPVGTTVRGEEIVTWAHDHANGLKHDLLLEDPGMVVNALRRHLNQGGASRSFAEDERFYVDVVDSRRKVFIVRSLADYTQQKAGAAFGKSARGAISPLEQAQKALNDIKLEELDEEQRKAMEFQIQANIATQVPLRKVLSEQAVERCVLRLEAQGYTKEQARTLIEVIPRVEPDMKLIKQIRG